MTEKIRFFEIDFFRENALVTLRNQYKYCDLTENPTFRIWHFSQFFVKTSTSDFPSILRRFPFFFNFIKFSSWQIFAWFFRQLDVFSLFSYWRSWRLNFRKKTWNWTFQNKIERTRVHLSEGPQKLKLSQSALKVLFTFQFCWLR